MVDKVERLVGALMPGSRLLRAWPLEGGISASMTAFEIERPDRSRRTFVLRRHAERYVAHHPRMAADEFALLQILQSAAVAAPRPCHLEPSGLFSTPCLVLEHIEGHIEFAPANLDAYLAQTARHLAQIHALDGGRADLAFLPRREARALPVDPPQASLLPAALRGMQPPAQVNPPVLLHGDYWPGNILWRERRLVGVIDWEDATIGDPLSDLGNIRLEILWALGEAAMERFTELYRTFAAIDCANLPY